MKLVETIQTKIGAFLEQSPFNSFLESASQKIGVEKILLFEVIIVGLLGIATILLGASTVVKLVCFIYPCLSTLKVYIIT